MHSPAPGDLCVLLIVLLLQQNARLKTAEGRVYFSSRFKVKQSLVVVGKVWQQEWEVASHVTAN